MRRKVGAWMLCLGFLLLLSLGFTQYSQTANYLLISIRLALIAVLSILFVRERWKYRHHQQGTQNGVTQDVGNTVLHRMRRWYYDQKN
jgi:uncharacterized membrane protein